MGRVNAYVKAGNNTGQTVSCGGRRGNPSEAWAWLNTDNRQGSASVTVTAEVTGNTDSRIRKLKSAGGDNRTSVFTVELPKPSEAVEVRIVEHGETMRVLAKMGAALCLAKGVIESGQDKKRSRRTIKSALKVLSALEAEVGKNLPNVELPGGISLSHAMACVKLVESLQEGKDN